MIINNPLQDDLYYIFLQTQPLWEELRNKKIFITGGTGFFGSWLLESFIFINKIMKLNAELTILTRDPKRFIKKFQRLASESSLYLHKGNIIDFIYPMENFSYIIHAAMDSRINTNGNNYSFIYNNIINGTKRTLEFAKSCGAKKFLFISSGAIYRKQACYLSLFHKNGLRKVDLRNFLSAYAAGKYVAESLCHLYAERYQFSVKIARCFSFVGPYLPLDLHYAIGNFIRDKLNNKTIIVKSDGSAYRSYLYAADLAIWLWTILFRGENLFSYNVGSDKALTIGELATIVANSKGPKVSVKIMQPVPNEKFFERYVPNITRTTEHLGLIPKISLADAINKTITWHIFRQQMNGV
ncbi:MAG: NAD(P)-dependent oxidoreductase [Pseudomonadota bacterium]